ncbi:39S ribosomal protein L28 [Mactra antiquata]
MPTKNYFPVFHKLKSGAYSYVWTDKCERLLPTHYKQRCLEYMLKEPKPVHWVPDPRKYKLDEYGTRHDVQNHPILVRYPVQCNYGLWGGEGTVQCYLRNVKGQKHTQMMTPRVAKFYSPYLVNRLLYSEILDKWYKIPCTNRAMDLIDEVFGLDYYILQTHERDINSKLGMDIKRLMLLRLCQDSKCDDLSEDRQKVFNRYKKFMIPEEEAEWVGLSTQEALEKAENEMKEKMKTPPLKDLIGEKYLQDLKNFNEGTNSEDQSGGEDEEMMTTSVKQVEKSTLSRLAAKIGIGKQ